MGAFQNVFGGGGSGDATLENQEAILAQLAAIEAKTGLITTGGQIPVEEDATGVRSSFIGETSKTITVTQDYTSTSIYFVLERFSATGDLLRVDNGEFTAKTATTLTIPLTQAIYGRSQFLKYAIRLTADNEVTERGTWRIKKAAL
jgi:hypothetical protein